MKYKKHTSQEIKKHEMTQEEIQNLNRDITCKEMELFNLNLPIKEISSPIRLRCIMLTTFKEHTLTLYTLP